MNSKLILAVASVWSMTVAPAALANLVTYNVQETFMEPTYGGAQNTVFNGTFTYDTVGLTISNLSGTLSEAMTAMMNGGVQKSVNLTFNPVSSISDGNGGIIAHAFFLNTTSIFSDGANDTHASMKQSGIANAYVTIDVSANQLSGANQFLPAASFDKLFYGDCQPGGMMGSMCMTGWGVSGSAGTMGGYPISEKVSAVPLPPAAWTFLSSIIGIMIFRKQRKTI